MKEFKKWEGTHSPGEYAYQKWEDGWRGAFELMLEWLEIEEPYEVFQARIKQEIENKQHSRRG